MAMAKSVPNFGQIAQAAKYGWKWMPELRLFVRITVGNGMHQVEIQPLTFKLDPDQGPVTMIDWRVQEGVVDLLPALTKYLGRSKPHTFYVNDDGMEVTPVIGNIPAGNYERGQEISVEISSEVSSPSEPGSQKEGE